MHKLVELIYFNKNFPQNYTLYPPNIKEKRLLVHTDGSWIDIRGNELSIIFAKVFNCAYSTALDKVNGGNMFRTDEEFMKLFPVAREIIMSFNMSGSHARLTEAEFMNLVIKNRNVVKDFLSKNAVAVT